MRLPRDVSGQQLADALSLLGYAVTRQKTFPLTCPAMPLDAAQSKQNSSSTRQEKPGSKSPASSSSSGP